MITVNVWKQKTHRNHDLKLDCEGIDLMPFRVSAQPLFLRRASSSIMWEPHRHIWVMWPFFLGCSWSGGTSAWMGQWDSQGMQNCDSRMQLVSGGGWTRGTCKLVLCRADIFSHVCGGTEKADLNREEKKQTHTDSQSCEPIRRQVGSSCLSSWQCPRVCFQFLVRCISFLLFCEMLLNPYTTSSFFHLH